MKNHKKFHFWNYGNETTVSQNVSATTLQHLHRCNTERDNFKANPVKGPN